MNGPGGLPGNSPLQRFERIERRGWLPHRYIAGLELANDGTDATNDIVIDEGVCRSECNIVNGAASTLMRDQMDIELPVAITKQLDVSWAPSNYDPDGRSNGDISGGRSAGTSISDTTWHVFAVTGPGRKADILIHSSVTQSSVLAELAKMGGYTAYRRVGSVLRESSTIVPFKQFSDEFIRVTPAKDIDVSTPGTSANTATLRVPLGVRVLARLNAGILGGGVYVSAMDQADQAVATTDTPLASVYDASNNNFGYLTVLTDTSGQVRLRASANNRALMVVLGWTDFRGKAG